MTLFPNKTNQLARSATCCSSCCNSTASPSPWAEAGMKRIVCNPKEEGVLVGTEDALDNHNAWRENLLSSTDSKWEGWGTELLVLDKECPLWTEAAGQEHSETPTSSWLLENRSVEGSPPIDLRVWEEPAPSCRSPVHPKEECLVELLSAHVLSVFLLAWRLLRDLAHLSGRQEEKRVRWAGE